jgi:hypothetical protein
MRKKIMIVLAILVAILLVGALYLKSNLDSIIQSAIQKYGTASTLATVKLDHVKLTLESGELALSGFSVGNPPGFPGDKSLYFGKVRVKIDTRSLTGTGPIIIQDVTINQPQIDYNVSNGGESNLQTLTHNTQVYAASFSSPKAQAATAGTAAPPRKIIINSLTISNGQIGISQALLQGRQLSAPLPVIHLYNIGKDSGGVTPAVIVEKILGAITNSASEVANINLRKTLGAGISSVGGGIVDVGGGAASQVKGLFGK